MRDLTELSDRELGTLAGSIIEKRAMGFVTDSDGAPLRELYNEIYEEIVRRDINTPHYGSALGNT